MTRQERKEQTAFNHMVKKHGHALVEDTKQIVPYTREQLQWHLTGNVFGLTPDTIGRIIEQCEGLNDGTYCLSDEIHPDTGISFGEMLDDLKIDYND